MSDKSPDGSVGNSKDLPENFAENTAKTPRGFAALTPEERKRIAAMGGRASHASGMGHEWTRAEARRAGRKGGIISRRGKIGDSASGNASQGPNADDKFILCSAQFV